MDLMRTLEMIRRWLLLSVVVLASVGGATSKGIHHLADQDRGHLLQADSFAVIRSADLIPLAVRASFAKSVKDSSFSMVNPGEKFQETDVILEPGVVVHRDLMGLFAGIPRVGDVL